MRGAGDLVLDVRARCAGVRTTVAVSAWGTVPVFDARTCAQACLRGQFASGRNKVPAREGIQAPRVTAHVCVRVTNPGIPVVSL